MAYTPGETVVKENDISTAEGYLNAQRDSTIWPGNQYKNQQEALHQLQEQSFNASEAQKQRDFELELSSTQYQRAVADMKKAGLNPASLTAGGISGAGSTPSGSSASYSSSKNQNNSKTAQMLGMFFLSLLKIAATAA